MRSLIAFIFVFVASIAQAELSTTSSRTISVTPTIDTNIYASGDALGGLMTLSAAGRPGVASGVIQSVLVSDLDSEVPDVDIVIFDSNPSATTVTNNAALDIADADLPKVVCILQITSSATFADNGAMFSNGNNCVFKADSVTGTIYAVAVVRATPTFTSASDLTFRFSILQD